MFYDSGKLWDETYTEKTKQLRLQRLGLLLLLGGTNVNTSAECSNIY